MFHKMPLYLLAVILGVVLLQPYLSNEVQAALYGVSLSIKNLLLFILPAVIFSLLFKTAVDLAHQATKLILLILAAVCCSNFLSTFISHYVGTSLYLFDLKLVLPSTINELTPLWQLQFPSWIANDKAMFGGLIGGVAFSLLMPKVAKPLALFLSEWVNKLLHYFTYIIPFFVAGFVVKLSYEGLVKSIFQQYAIILAIIVIAQFSYITFIYLLANNLKIKQCLQALKNMLPATIAGFSTMSSASAMPLTILGTQKNAHNADFARSIIPTTVNVHLIGDCFAIPILAYAILKSYGAPEPLLIQYLIFSGYFVLAKFSVAAVPGGGIFVMLPILESYLGFNSPMLSLITALYLLFDPFITAANVLGNGGFAIFLDKYALRSEKTFFAKKLQQRC
ncbi:cation:dicarboxylate symporter family transporter [Candidatus Berkiella aquae]|uniref:Dicarboxylate/amino acid:cation symporter n=1 Tax=Candidatus Berkiella aquae TaxID=295108 RepID=A0A0Q9YRB0_9GAMM|nr:cation:dicarboxylase symporter family transporter [Candidatus Berkiella aquae]MCS5712358.1 dicarboxylate/amino acid:cation symporter [Candidatus Berkiella aquae]